MRFRLVVDGEPHDIEAARTPSGISIKVDGAPYRAFVEREGNSLRVRVGPRRHVILVRGTSVSADGRHHVVEIPSGETQEGPGSTGPAGARGGVFEIRPPMPGRVVKLPVSAGRPVRRGQAVAVLEAMKMQNEILSPADGVVREVRVREGETIGSDRVLVIIDSS